MLLENLHTDFTLEIAAHKAEGSDQLKNATAANVQKILAEFGESRLLVKEGGRTKSRSGEKLNSSAPQYAKSRTA